MTFGEKITYARKQKKLTLSMKLFPITSEPLLNGILVVENDGTIYEIIDPLLRTELPEEIDYRHGFICPGFINTHCHLDHIFGVHACIQRYTVPFSFHALEQQVYDWAPEAGMRYGVPVAHSPAASHYIDATQVIKLGEDELHILFTPGHSPGHICLYSAANNFVIAGDVIFQNSIGRTDLPGGDFDTLIQSIHQQIFTLPDATIIYNGHGPATTVGLEKMNNPYVGK